MTDPRIDRDVDRDVGRDVDRDVDRAERALLVTLAVWAGASTAAGTACWAAGRDGRRPVLAAFGRQFAAWGLVDGVIAAVGARSGRRARRAGRRPDPTVRARRLRRITAVNAVADVGYLAVGGALVRAAQRPARHGDGAAIVLQGLFLAWLDVRFARRFGRLTGGGGAGR